MGGYARAVGGTGGNGVYEPRAAVVKKIAGGPAGDASTKDGGDGGDGGDARNPGLGGLGRASISKGGAESEVVVEPPVARDPALMIGASPVGAAGSPTPGNAGNNGASGNPC